MSGIEAAVVVAYVLLLVVSLALAGVIRQVRLLSRKAALVQGPSPGGSLRRATEQLNELDIAQRAGPGLLLLLDRDCRVCHSLITHLEARLERDDGLWCWQSIGC